MGLITGLMRFLFGDGRNVVAETAQVFCENAEAGAVSAADARADSLQQFAAVFAHPTRGVFDRIVDGLNRLPRPALALGTIWLFVSAMRAPEEFARGMQGLALVPEPLWWLRGAIGSFYFGVRHQVKAFEFKTAFAQALSARRQGSDEASDNAALQEWQGRDGQ
jgi:hypothetical protein